MKRIVALLTVAAMFAAASTTQAQVLWGQPGAPNGSSGSSLDFAGGFLTSDLPSSVFDSGYTMSLWLSPDEIPGESFFLGQTDQGIHHGLRNEGKLHQAHWGADHSGATTVPTGDASDAASWVHATYTWDAATEIGTIYYNGAADDGGAVSKRAPNRSGLDNFMIIGARNNGQARFNGQIDDVAFWNTVLPAADIANLAAGTVSPTDLSAPVYYAFDEGMGSYAVNTGTTGAFTSGQLGSGDFDLFIPDPPPPAEVATDLAAGNWSTRIVNLTDAPGSTTAAFGINEAVNASDFSVGGGVLSIACDNRSRIDMAGGGGSFPSNHPYANGVNDGSQVNFVVTAMSVQPFHFPEGTYTIAFGSDDGGGITLTDADGGTFTFDSEFNTDAGDTGVDDTAVFDAPRGHQWTGGVFTVAAGGANLYVDGLMFENGGGDSFEIAVAAGEQAGFTGNGFFRTLAGEEFGITVASGYVDRGHEVCAVPEPSAAVLFLGMGLSILGLRRKRN